MVGDNTQCEDQFLYSPNCTLFERTLQQIAADSNASFLSLPSKSNPVLGSSAEDNNRSNNLQTDEKIWFLVGAVDNQSKKRAIKVPLGWPLFVPILTRDVVVEVGEELGPPDFVKLYADARKYKNDIDKASLKLEIDKCSFGFDALIKYYLESVPFSVLIPQDNVYKKTDEPIDSQLEDKVVTGVCTGIFVPLKPLLLESEAHTISFYAKHGRGGAMPEFIVDVTYTINIEVDHSPKLSRLGR